MQERIPDSDYQQLHHFISESNRDAFGVMRTVANQTQQSLSTLQGEQGLLLDESGWEKAGAKSVGVARQYIGQVSKVCNAQAGVFAALVRADRIGLVKTRDISEIICRLAEFRLPNPSIAAVKFPQAPLHSHQR